MVELVAPDGDVMAVGLGLPVSTASIVGASGDPPYLASVGNRTGDDPIVFYYYGDWSEFPPRFIVPDAAAREGLRRFLAGERPPNNLQWEEV